jgi:hypothetical protein
MKWKIAVCAFLGHSRIIEGFLGYQYCGRCGEQVGDTLGGAGIRFSVGIGHNCKTCQENYKQMTWRDKLFVRYPFTEEQ